MLDVNMSSLLSKFEAESTDGDDERQPNRNDRTSIFGQFIEFVRISLTDDVLALQNTCNIKIHHSTEKRFMGCLLRYLDTELDAVSKECLLACLNKYRELLTPANILEEIGGVQIMKEIFSSLYGRIESD